MDVSGKMVGEIGGKGILSTHLRQGPSQVCLRQLEFNHVQLAVWKISDNLEGWIDPLFSLCEGEGIVQRNIQDTVHL